MIDELIDECSDPLIGPPDRQGRRAGAGGRRGRRLASRSGGKRAGRTDEWLTERQVEVHRAALRRIEGPERQRPPRRRAGVVGDAGIVEPPHGPRVQMGLIDRLRGADVSQFGWPVGRDHHHGHIGEPGLDHGRMEVGRRRAARAEQHRRHAVEPDPERDERGHPLVVHDVHRHALVRRERNRHRRAP
jgi:hypothetical protein